MNKPRIIIADTDINYIIPLQLKFIEEFFDKVDLEIINDKDYYNQLFSTPQKIDILILSEEMYDSSLNHHNIGSIFLMTEQYEKEMTAELNINRIYKYTSIKEIMNEITGKSAEILNVSDIDKRETQIIVVYSASGGVGKTTVALGISACLTKNYKRVLYINASRLQTFQRILDNQSSITASDVYTKLAISDENTYNNVKHVIRQELFSYLPPFKSALMSLGLDYSIYEQIAIGAKRSKEYDFIIIDADSNFDEDKAKLIDMADKVLIVTKQNEDAVYSSNILVSNINGASTDKYIFVCNDFDKEKDNALISPGITMKFSVNEYIEHIEHYDNIKIEDLSKEKGIQKTAFLVI